MISKNGTAKRLLDNAQQLIIDKGYGNASIQDIASLVGITKSAFFYHFRSKETLLNELITEATNSLIFLKSGYKAIQDPSKKLQRAFAIRLPFTGMVNYFIACLEFKTMISLVNEIEELPCYSKKFIIDYFRTLDLMVAELITPFCSDDFEAANKARLFMCTVIGSSIRRKLFEESPLVIETVTILLSAISDNKIQGFDVKSIWIDEFEGVNA